MDFDSVIVYLLFEKGLLEQGRRSCYILGDMLLTN